MKISYLNGNRLYYAFLAGGQAVIQDQLYLNKINVFPVPDADTGTNLASTMRFIAGRAKASKSVKHTMESIADAALQGARGNSGLIFAQFVFGLSREIKQEIRLTTQHFAESVKGAADYARSAILSPVEGTMITLIQDWADALYEKRHKMRDFAELLYYSLHIVEKSLKDTPKKLAVLARAGVVDAGAKGFVDFLEGVVQFIQKGSLKDILQEEAPDITPPTSDIHTTRAEVTQRFCAEALIVGRDIDTAAIRDLVQRAGESAIVAGGRSKVRVHLHTDRPADLFFQLQDYGAISEIKADDMLRQYEAAHEKKSSIALLTDSTCDLPQEILDEHQIHLIPFSISFGDSLFLDKITMAPEQFYRLLRMRRKMPTSSQPSQATVQRQVEFLSGHYDSILAVTISEKLTGIFGQVLKARDNIGPSQMGVLDSKNLSVSLALIVLRIAEAIRNGRSFDEIMGQAPDWIEKTKLWVDIRTLKYMVRGGRVSPLKGMVATLFNIKPIISLDEEGKAKALGKSFSRGQNLRKIIAMIRRETEGHKVWKYGIVHAQNRYRALHYAARLTEILKKEPAFISDVSPVVGVHNGIGVVGVGLMFE